MRQHRVQSRRERRVVNHSEAVHPGSKLIQQIWPNARSRRQRVEIRPRNSSIGGLQRVYLPLKAVERVAAFELRGERQPRILSKLMIQPPIVQIVIRGAG